MESENARQLSCQVCIIGSGPAGLIVALEYCRLRPQAEVLLVEYGYPGQPERNRLDDAIRLNSLRNHHDPYECTNKGLGGTSQTWGGRCVMYDPIDFMERPVVAGACTWDMELFDELAEDANRAAEYFECGASTFNLNDAPHFQGGRIAENFVEGDITDSAVERWSTPTRFGVRYAEDIASLPNLTLLEACEARDFSSPDETGKVSRLTVRDVRSGEIHEVKAERFVLAAGAQETTRMLLRNPQLFKALGSPPDALGKYYQGHLSGKIASVQFDGDPAKTDYGFLRDKDGTYIRRRFQFSTECLRERNLLNTAIWLDNPLYYDPSHRSGAMSFMYLAMLMPVLGKKLAPPAIAHSITKGKVTGVPQHLRNILKGLPGSLLTPAVIFFKRYCQKRKLPGVFLYSPENRYALHFHAEQIPVATNRMELDGDGETLNIHYELTDEDVESVINTHDALDKWLRKCGCGKLEYWFGPTELATAIREMSRDGIHQSGTTRISGSSHTGVVDRDLKVWGTQNVFVCSSSVFPTSSQANPTFMLGAFAVRLARYLTNEIS